MSTVKAGGSTKNNHNSPGQRLGVKRFGGETVKTGDIIIRQVGQSKVPGSGTFMTHNYTIHASRDGVVAFEQRKVKRFTGKTVPRTVVSVK